MQPAIDVQGAVDAVEHAFSDDHGTLRARDRWYDVTLDAAGFLVAPPSQPTASKRPSGLRISYASSTPIAEKSLGTAPSWQARGNVATRRLSSFLVERVTAGARRVKWDFIVERAPIGVPSISVTATLAGVRRAERVRDGLRIWTDETTALIVGELVVVDAHNRELHRAFPTLNGATLGLSVPRLAIRAAEFPITLDPTVGPESAVGATPLYGSGPAGPKIATNGDIFMVVWADWCCTYPAHIVATRLTADGHTLDPAAIPITTRGRALGFDVAWDGTNFVVAWSDLTRRPAWMDPVTGIHIDDSDVYAARISPAGEVLDVDGFPVVDEEGPQSLGGLAWNGASYLVAWNESLTRGDTRSYGTLMTSERTLIRERMPLWTNGDHATKGLVWTGENFVAAGVIDGPVPQAGGQTYPNAAFLGRLAADGAVLDPVGIPLSLPGMHVEGGPSLASVGSTVVIVWRQQRGPLMGYDVWGASIDVRAPIPQPFQVAHNLPIGSLSVPTVGLAGADPAAGTSAFVVAWPKASSSFVEELHTTGLTVGPSGTALIGESHLLSEPRDESASGASIATSAGRTIVVWNAGSRFVTLAGAPYGDRFPVTFSAASERSPAIAWNGEIYLIVWASDRPPYTEPDSWLDVYAARVDAQGRLLDAEGIVVTNSFDHQWNPAVGWNGTEFIVAWSHWVGSDHEIRGSLISPAGVVRDPNGVVLEDTATTYPQIDIACGASGCMMVWLHGETVKTIGVGPDGLATGSEAVVGQGDSVAISASDVSFAVAWGGSYPDRKRLFVRGLKPDGTPAGPEQLIGASLSGRPVVASTASEHLVAWSADGGTWGRVLRSDGVVRDAAAFSIASAASPSVIEWNGSAYINILSGNDGWTVRSILPDGSVGEGITVASAAENISEMEATFAGYGRVTIVYERRLDERPYLGARKIFLRTIVGN